MTTDVRKHHGQDYPVGTEINEPHPRYIANDYLTGYRGEYLTGVDAISRIMEGIFPDWEGEDEDSYSLEADIRAAYVFEIVGEDGKNMHEIPLPTFILTNRDEGRKLFGYVLSNPVDLRTHIEKPEVIAEDLGNEKKEKEPGCPHCLNNMITGDFWDAYGMTLITELPDINDDESGWKASHTKKNYSMGKLKQWQWRHDFWSDTIPLWARARGGSKDSKGHDERNKKLTWHNEMKGKCRRWVIWDALHRDKNLKNSELTDVLKDAVGKSYTIDAIKKIKRRIHEIEDWSDEERAEVLRYGQDRGWKIPDWIKVEDSGPPPNDPEPEADHHDSDENEEMLSLSTEIVSRGNGEPNKSFDLAAILAVLDDA